MADLASFLLARVVDDEKPTWELVPYTCPPGCCAPAGYVGHRCLICKEESFGGTVDVITAISQEHDENIHHRSRMLADCRAKRDLLMRYTSALSGAKFHPDQQATYMTTFHTLTPVVKRFAQAYSSHSEFDWSWQF